jgi:hypothetical protein
MCLSPFLTIFEFKAQSSLAIGNGDKCSLSFINYIRAWNFEFACCWQWLSVPPFIFLIFSKFKALNFPVKMAIHPPSLLFHLSHSLKLYCC